MRDTCLLPVPSSAACRRRDRRLMLRVLGTGLLVPALPLSAQARMALATAINRTARFRALSQRMAKAYGQLYLDVRPARARDVLGDTQRQMRSGFEDMAHQGWPPEVARLLADMRRSADRLDALAEQAPSRNAFQAVSAQADQMLALADTATQALERQAQAPTARLVNTAGRQRMLSQRMAKNYELAAAGLDGRPVREQLAGDADEFQRALAQLLKAPISTLAIRTALELGQAQWLFFDAALKRPPDGRGLEEVATTSERLLEVMDGLTALYEAALQDLLG